MISRTFVSTDIEEAIELDGLDELFHYRDLFVSGASDLIYLNGNSLGRLPKKTAQLLGDFVEAEWGEQLIRAWNQGWYRLSVELGSKIARLVGANPGELIVADSTSVNLFKLVLAAVRSKPDRARIVTDELNFPSDLYILQSVIDLLGGAHELKTIRSRDGLSIEAEDIKSALDDNTSLVCLSHVSFRSGFMYDLSEVTRMVHWAGALMLWDLSHSVGTVPIDLAAADADLAVGCTYKYMNSGPGAPAFLYVKKGLQEKLRNPIWGWFAAERPFSFEAEFRPARGIESYLVGTPPILSMKAIEPALDMILQAGTGPLREKSVRMTEYILHLTECWLRPFGFEVASPLESSSRGSHVSLKHPEAFRIACALRDEVVPGPLVVTDFREPDNLRLGVAALYNSFQEIYRALNRLRSIMQERCFERFSEDRREVT